MTSRWGQKVNLRDRLQPLQVAFFASSVIGAVGWCGNVTASAAPVDAAMTTLANEMVSGSTRISSSATLSAEIKPISDTLNSAAFDWNMALFGTDSTSGTQSAVFSTLVPAMRQLTSFSVATTGAATSLISGVVDGFQSLNSGIKADDVISFLQVMEQNTAFQTLSILGQSPSVSQLEGMVHSSINAAVQSSSPLIAATFAGTGGSTTVASAGGVGASVGSSQSTPTGTGTSLPASPGASASSGDTSTSSISGSQETGPASSGGSSSDVAATGGDGSAADDGGFSGSGGSTTVSGGSGSVPSQPTTTGAGGHSGGSRSASKGVSTSKGDVANGNPPNMYGAGLAGVYVNNRLISQTSFVRTGRWAYISLYATMQALRDFKVHSHWNGHNLYVTLPKDWGRVAVHALSAEDPKDIGLYVDGKRVASFGKFVRRAPTSRQLTTFVPVGQLLHVLRDLGFTVQSNGRQMNLSVQRS